jgi:uncharacterized OB-fold protein
MTEQSLGAGKIYTETVVWAAPEAHVKEAPYQMAIVLLDAGGRLTVRILGDRVQIGDAVTFAEYRDGVAYFRKPA